MLEEIKKLFDAFSQLKLIFSPEVRVTKDGPPIWIDNMYKIRDCYMVTVSNNEDKVPMNLDVIDNSYLASLKVKLQNLSKPAAEIQKRHKKIAIDR